MTPEECNKFMEELGCVFDRDTMTWHLRISHEQRITDSMIRDNPQMVMEHVLEQLQKETFNFIWELREKSKNYGRPNPYTHGSVTNVNMPFERLTGITGI